MPQNGLGLRRFGDKQPPNLSIKTDAPDVDQADEDMLAAVFEDLGYELDGELIPYCGSFTSKDGSRWIDGAPAFLIESRPISRIQ